MIKLQINRKNEYAGKLRAAAEAAAEVLGQKGAFSASLDFAGKQRMRLLNLKFRGTDKPTDVLSFPNLALGRPASLTLPEIRPGNWPLETESDGSVFLGDIVICPWVARKQSGEYGHSAERETVYLFTHGLLHLFGFDHLEESDKKLMREAEEKILGRIDIKS